MNMTNEQYNAKVNSYASTINEALNSLLTETCKSYQPVIDAMKYSLMAGGKRIRPMLLLEFNRICGGSYETALPFACAMEMIHTYSLIHDDLPCMDNDTLRRGKPTCHVKFGETTAVLAGDGLLTYAFETMSSVFMKNSIVPQANIMRAIHEMAAAAGYNGMIGGQIIDTDEKCRPQNLAQLKELQELKTGAIIKAACKVGCILAGASQEQIEKACEYADCIGLAFQIEDDILDIISTGEQMGKTVGKDLEQNKVTFPGLVGMEESLSTVDSLTSQAVTAVSSFEDAEFLQMLAQKLKDRKC